MASPARSLTPREEAGVLRDFYLVLWKQLDLRSGESNWFDMAAASAPDLQVRADELLRQAAELQGSPELLLTALHNMLRRPPGAAEIDELMAYLRDRALGFAQEAAHLS